MITGVVNKIIITAEAVFDYEAVLDLGTLDKRLLKNEISDYISLMNRSGRLLYEDYFRCKFYDEGNDRLLLLFFYRADKISIIQNWRLAGICLAEDWDEDMEYEGKIRAWLKTRVTDLADEDDWAIKHRVNQVLKETEKTLFENVLEEVINVFTDERDKEVAKELAFLQSVYFERGRERTKPKTRKGRKSCKRS